MRLRSKPESLPTRMLSAPKEIGRRAVQHMPMVPDRYKQRQPERSMLAKGAIAAGAVALAAAGAMAARRIMSTGRILPSQESTTMDWHQSEQGRMAEHSHDGATPVMASPSETMPDMTDRS